MCKVGWLFGFGTSLSFKWSVSQRPGDHSFSVAPTEQAHLLLSAVFLILIYYLGHISVWTAKFFKNSCSSAFWIRLFFFSPAIFFFYGSGYLETYVGKLNVSPKKDNVYCRLVTLVGKQLWPRDDSSVVQCGVWERITLKHLALYRKAGWKLKTSL